MSDCPIVKENEDLKAKIKKYEGMIFDLKEQIRDMLLTAKNQ